MARQHLLGTGRAWPHGACGGFRHKFIAGLAVLMVALLIIYWHGDDGAFQQNDHAVEGGEAPRMRVRKRNLKVYTESQLGVQRLRVPGTLEKSGDTVLLHLWIRQHEVDDVRSLSGFGFMETIGYTHTYIGIDLLQHNDSYVLAEAGALQLYRGRNRDAPILSFNVTMAQGGEHELGRPFWVYADLPSDLPAMQTYDLMILNWSRFARFTMPASTQALTELDGSGAPGLPPNGWLAGPDKPAPPLNEPSPQVVFVLRTFHNVDPAKTIALLLGHITWHRDGLGLAGYLIYILPEYIPAVASNAHLIALQQQGFVQFVLWDQQMNEYMTGGGLDSSGGCIRNDSNFIAPDQGETPYADQAHIYNHALLVSSWRNVTLLIADVDEFLITTEPSSAAEVVRGCFGNGISSAVLHWRVSHCEQCQQPEIVEWMAALRPAEDMPGETITMGGHPLRRYTKITDDSYQSYGKSLVVPERTHMYRHHEGYGHRGGHENSSPLCKGKVSILHLLNLWTNRGAEGNMVNDTSWLWPFEGLPKDPAPDS